MSLTLTELLIAAALLIGALLIGIWIGALIWKKYKNLAEEWSREYHEKLEMYTSLQEAHDTLNAQFTKDRDAIGGIQTKLEASVNERSELERQMGEMRQQQEQLQQQLANAREEARQAQQHATGEVDSIKAELEVEKSMLEEARKSLQRDREALSEKIIAMREETSSAMASPSPEAQVSRPAPPAENGTRAEADRQRLSELENSIGRLKKQILLLMPFQGKFERALKDMEALKQSEAQAIEKAARAEASVQASKSALKEASRRLGQLDDVETRYHTAQNSIHKLNLALGIVRPYKEQAEKLEKKVRSLNNKIKKLQSSSPEAQKPVAKAKVATKKPAQTEQEPPASKTSVKRPAAKKTAVKKPVAKKPVENKATAKKPAAKKSTKAETLKRIQAKASQVDFDKIGTATASAKDDLKKIKGIGPFLEEKLNSIGIYTFDQISRFTPTIEKKVNEIIEFFPGRIKRDQWKKQASHLLKEKNQN
jgi:predicted flap endonuclease-1-like 5' DNA nuclease/archaellum component FlaC